MWHAIFKTQCRLASIKNSSSFGRRLHHDDDDANMIIMFMFMMIALPHGRSPKPELRKRQKATLRRVRTAGESSFFVCINANLHTNVAVVEWGARVEAFKQALKHGVPVDYVRCNG